MEITEKKKTADIFVQMQKSQEYSFWILERAF